MHYERSPSRLLFVSVEKSEELVGEVGDAFEDSRPTSRATQSTPNMMSSEVRKLLLVVALLTFAAFSNWAALAYTHDFVGRQPLPDIIFSVIPEQPWALKVGDAMVTICAALLITLMVLHRSRITVIRRTLFILACLYTMRTISLLCTQLPSGYIDNDIRCQNRRNSSNERFQTVLARTLQQAIKLGFQDMDNRMLCGDLLFSGHTTVMVISSLSVGYYLPFSMRALRFIPRILAYIGMICMIISRTHYTVDVIFAYWLTTAAFSIYHGFCELETEQERKNSVLYRLWIVKFVGWLENGTATGRLRNELKLPCFGPLHCWCTLSSRNRVYRTSQKISEATSTTACNAITARA